MTWLNHHPELKHLPPDERRREWRGGLRYALNRWPFLLISVALFSGFAVFNTDVVKPLTSDKLWRSLLLVVSLAVLYTVWLRVAVHYARPYWRELRPPAPKS